MSYCTIVYTEGYYELAYRAMKIIQLDRDAEFGDVFDNYILCDQGNPSISESKERILKCGEYVNLVPLNLISVLRSNRDDIEIKGFKKYKDETKFYPLLGFEMDGEELGEAIVDLDESKATTKIEYYYKRIDDM